MQNYASVLTYTVNGRFYFKLLELFFVRDVEAVNLLAVAHNPDSVSLLDGNGGIRAEEDIGIGLLHANQENTELFAESGNVGIMAKHRSTASESNLEEAHLNGLFHRY